MNTHTTHDAEAALPLTPYHDAYAHNGAHIETNPIYDLVAAELGRDHHNEPIGS